MEVHLIPDSRWRSLHSLARLVKQGFPEGTWTERIVDGTHIIDLSSTHRHLLHEDSLRYCKELAEHVERLGYRTKKNWHDDDDARVVLSPQVYAVLESCHVLPLPNLQACFVSTLVDFVALPRVAGPKTAVLEIGSLQDEPPCRRPAVVQLPRSLPTLRLSSPDIPKEVHDSLILFLSGKHRLQTLQLPSSDVLGKPIFTSILASKHLSDLDIGLVRKEYLQLVPAQPFPKIRFLQLTVDCADDLIEFLQRISSRKLSKLQVISITCITPLDVRSVPPAQRVKAFFSEVVASCERHLPNLPLAGINFTFCIDDPCHLRLASLIRSPQDAITLDTIAPLFKLKNFDGSIIRYQANYAGEFVHYISVRNMQKWFQPNKTKVVIHRVWNLDNVVVCFRRDNYELITQRTSMIGC